MDRIDLETVKRAYEVTGLHRVRGRWGTSKGNCGCPMSAVCVAMEQGHPGDQRNAVDSVWYAAEHLDLPKEYVYGFVTAIDGMTAATVRSEDVWMEGYNDGLKVKQGLRVPRNMVSRSSTA